MSLFPHSAYFFALSPHAMIMNPSLSLTGHVMDRGRLESIMLRDKPVVPPDSVIHTFSHLKGNQIDLVITQDGEGLCPESFVLRRGEWSNFFLDVWFDPLYRSYNFQKAEAHALVSILASLVVCVLTVMAGTHCAVASHYSYETRARASKNSKFLYRRDKSSGWQGGNVPRWRFCCSTSRLRERQQPQLRERTGSLVPKMEGDIRTEIPITRPYGID